MKDFTYGKWRKFSKYRGYDRDITRSEMVSCIPGKERLLDAGKQTFFEKAKTYFLCVVRVEDLKMDFFNRNNTCYYVRKKK